MINNSVLVGRLTADPNLRYTSSGKAVAQFTLAVNRGFKDANGNDEADFINCVTWEKRAENLANYQRKGSLIGITGSIRTRNYENQQGQRVYVTEILVNNIQFLESRKGNDNNNQPQNDRSNQGNDFGGFGDTKPPSFEGNNFSNDNNTISIDESDLPF